MQVYVATGIGNLDAFDAVAAILTPQGHTLAFDWTRDADGRRIHPTGGDVVAGAAINVAEMGRRALAEYAGVCVASALIALYPCGKGTQREIGMACMRRIPVLILGTAADLRSPYPCTFDYLPEVRAVEVDSMAVAPIVAAAWLDGLARRAPGGGSTPRGA